MAGSPLVYEDKVIVNPGGKLQRGVIAYDRLTGKVIWTGSYAAPRVESINGRPVVLIFDANGAAGHDPKDGSQLWRYPFTNQPRINAAQMIVHRNYVLISSGYGTGCALLDTSHPADDGRPRDVWPPNRKLKMKFNGGVYRDGIVFGLDEGIIVCFDVQSGTRRWKKGRFGYGQMLLAGEHLLVQAESGEVVLLEANVDRYVELGRFQAIEGKTWNHPVLHRGRLFVRNAGEAACYDIR